MKRVGVLWHFFAFLQQSYETDCLTTSPSLDGNGLETCPPHLQRMLAKTIYTDVFPTWQWSTQRPFQKRIQPTFYNPDVWWRDVMGDENSVRVNVAPQDQQMQNHWMDIFAHHIGVVEPGPQKHNRSSPNSYPCTQNGFPLFRQSLDAVVPCKSATSGCITIKNHLTTDRSSDIILSCVPFRNMCYYKTIPTVGIFIIQFSRPRAPKYPHG